MSEAKQGKTICPSADATLAAPPGSIFTLRNIRINEALARFGGDEERYRHWLVEFINHGPNAASQIRQAITSGSQDAAIKLAHALKGRTGMLGMSELHSVSQTLEMALKNGEPPQLWLEELESTVDEMSRQIEAAFGKTTT
jgi:two-component system, sensor histidine kinase and response regulator